MSIIYEALRRIESQKPKADLESDSRDIEENKNNENDNSVATIQGKTVAGYLKKKKNILLFSKRNILVLLAALVLVFAGFFIFSKNIQTPGTLVQGKNTVSSSVVNSAQVQESSTFILEGIVYDEKMPLAIINARLYKHYDRLGEYMIVDISEREVTLRNINDESLLHIGLPF